MRGLTLLAIAVYLVVKMVWIFRSDRTVAGEHIIHFVSYKRDGDLKYPKQDPEEPTVITNTNKPIALVEAESNMCRLRHKKGGSRYLTHHWWRVSHYELQEIQKYYVQKGSLKAKLWTSRIDVGYDFVYSFAEPGDGADAYDHMLYNVSQARNFALPF